MHVSLVCSHCRTSLKTDAWTWRCADCHSPVDFAEEPPPLRETVSLGEPITPLVEVTLGPLAVYAKIEAALPTGSFKDRGSRVVVSALLAQGVRRAVIDSSGNAGASLAAYCARAGIDCDVYVPESVSPAKLAQISAFGARVVPVGGTREDVAAAAQATNETAAYAAHGWSPWFLAGTRSFGEEVVAQLGRAPDVVVMPVGAGTLLLGTALHFARLVREGSITRPPRLYGVQPVACAPLAVAAMQGIDEAAYVEAGETAAEGARIAKPPRGRQVLRMVRDTGGSIVTATDEELWLALTDLAHRGILVEPTSALAFAALGKLPLNAGETVVVAATASGLKAMESLRWRLEGNGPEAER